MEISQTDSKPLHHLYKKREALKLPLKVFKGLIENPVTMIL
jgi:hypothetical protein